MIRVILIDDEKPALRELEYLLKSMSGVLVVGMYTDPHEGINAAGQLKPDAVFLDIHMPQLMGIDAASVILDSYPEARVVFVTAYEQYAIEAFDLFALDYVLKPVSEARLRKTIGRLRQKTESPITQSKHLLIRCLGSFEIGWEGEAPIKWRTEKTRELFAFLLFNRGRMVNKGEIIDALWPDADPGRADHQLHNAVYYIRKTLSNYGISREQLCISGCYRLELSGIQTDVDRFELYCEDVQLSNGDETAKLDIYRGAYFEDAGWIWAEAKRERLANLYVRTAVSLAKEAMKTDRFKDAEQLLTETYQQSPYEESITKMLLMLYGQIGEKTKAARHYKAYCEMLKHDLGIRPSRDIALLGNVIMG